MQKPNKSIKEALLFQAMSSFIETYDRRTNSSKVNRIMIMKCTEHREDKKKNCIAKQVDTRESLSKERDETKYKLKTVKAKHSELEIKLMLLKSHFAKFKAEVHELKTTIRNHQTLFVMMR